MFFHRPSCRARWLTCVWLCIASTEGAIDGQQSGPRARHPGSRMGAMADGASVAALERAIRGAARRLTVPACEALLDEFADVQGRPLRETANMLAASSVRPLDRIVFRDGRSHRDCTARAVVAFTSPGSRVVFVCTQRFAKLARDRAEQVIIHELLHTLGLPERPPTSAAIDHAVARRCSSSPRD